MIENIALVDDEASQRKTFGKVIRTVFPDVPIHEYSQGNTFLEDYPQKLESGEAPFGLVTLDYSMNPGLNGRETREYMLDSGYDQDGRVVLLCVQEADILAEMEELGIFDAVIKKGEIAPLINDLRGYLATLEAQGKTTS